MGGFLYAVGSRSYRGGPHIIDISDPKNPRFVSGFDSDGYTHDAEIVVYRGPDTRYRGHEIYFGYNEDTLTILDVSDKDDVKMLSRTPYRNNYYTHQGWLTEDHTHLLLNDELDEQSTSEKHTRTLQWDVQDLTDAKFIGAHISTEMSIDHNLYIKGNRAYMSNYCSGLRVLDVSRIGEATTPEIGFFDMAPYCDADNRRCGLLWDLEQLPVLPVWQHRCQLYRTRALCPPHAGCHPQQCHEGRVEEQTHPLSNRPVLCDAHCRHNGRRAPRVVHPSAPLPLFTFMSPIISYFPYS